MCRLAMPVRIMYGKRYSISHTIRIESQLGFGGSGAVYKAWHKRLRKFVVVKEVKHSADGDIEARRNEVEALKNVKSAFLPQVFDFLAKGDYSYTLMEFVEGESFDKLLERGQKFTEAQVVKWYAQLSSALEAIHRKNVFHRDIKPANIMLSTSGDVYLIDFNAALVGGSCTRIVSRSLGYASPEQYELFMRVETERCALDRQSRSAKLLRESCNNDVETQLVDYDNITELVEDVNPPPSINVAQHHSSANSSLCYLKSGIAGQASSNIDWKRSDIYSLGATMYHLLTGKRPSEMAKNVAILKRGRFSKSVVRIIERSMQCSPTERYASATHLGQALSEIYKQDAQRASSKKKKIAAILAIAAIALIIGSRKLNAT